MKLKHLLLTALLGTGMMLNAAAPRYIFYFIGDGMGMGHVMAAQSYNRTVLGNNDPILMMQFPVAASAHTYSASSPVTDSAAAGTALATGHKTKNGMLGMDADTIAVQSIAKDLKADGFGIGLVTSVAPDDATPGAFYAHVPNRGLWYDVCKDYITSGYEFLGGANIRGTNDGQPTEILKEFEKKGIKVATELDQLKNFKSKRVAVFKGCEISPYEIGYTIDSLENAMTLPALTEACLAHLEKVSPKKFFMMVEGGNIDHAAHANDGGAVIKEILNFNQAIKVAYDFYLAHPDETLIVITADHDTGGMAIGSNFTGYNAYLQYIDHQKMSKDAFSDWCRALLKSRRNYTWEDMKEFLTENLGFWKYVPVNEEQTSKLQNMFESTFELRNSADQKTLYNNFNAFAVEVFNVMNDVAGIGWISNNHTGNEVPVYAIGVGADKFASFNNNTDIPVKIMSIVKQ